MAVISVSLPVTAGVVSAAEITTTGVGESQRAAADLARMSSELQALVGNFRY
jgi:methyl-accepting chemotaxis protein